MPILNRQTQPNYDIPDDVFLRMEPVMARMTGQEGPWYMLCVTRALRWQDPHVVMPVLELLLVLLGRDMMRLVIGYLYCYGHAMTEVQSLVMGT